MSISKKAENSFWDPNPNPKIMLCDSRRAEEPPGDSYSIFQCSEDRCIIEVEKSVPLYSRQRSSLRELIQKIKLLITFAIFASNPADL